MGKDNLVRQQVYGRRRERRGVFDERQRVRLARQPCALQARSGALDMRKHAVGPRREGLDRSRRNLAFAIGEEYPQVPVESRPDNDPFAKLAVSNALARLKWCRRARHKMRGW